MNKSRASGCAGGAARMRGRGQLARPKADSPQKYLKTMVQQSLIWEPSLFSMQRHVARRPVHLPRFNSLAGDGRPGSRKEKVGREEQTVDMTSCLSPGIVIQIHIDQNSLENRY